MMNCIHCGESPADFAGLRREVAQSTGTSVVCCLLPLPALVSEAPFWGACGVEGCTRCLPLYNARNEPILRTD